jgi:Papain family cysteine protease
MTANEQPSMSNGIPEDATFINEISAYGGLQISAIDQELIATPVLRALQKLAISDVEQLIALAAVPSMMDELPAALDLSSEKLLALIEKLKGRLPQGRVEEFNRYAPQYYGLGALLPTDEISKEYEQIPFRESQALPASVNLIPRMPLIRNQASRGTCVAFGATALHDGIFRVVHRFSEQFLYYICKTLDGQADRCGTWLVYATRALSETGQCHESIWPYNPQPPCNNHGALPINAVADAAQNRLHTVNLNPGDVIGIKSALSAGTPVPFCIRVYNSWYQNQYTVQTGRINMRIGNEAAIGGHCMCLVGYQDNSASPGGGDFILRNSWGTSWAYQSPYGAGYGTIPYEYLAVDGTEAATRYSV